MRSYKQESQLLQYQDVYSVKGFDDYIQKPFDLDHLYNTLRRYIPKYLPEEAVPTP